MALIDYIDGPNRRIHLSIDTMNTAWHPAELYNEVRALRKVNENLRSYDNFMEGAGNVNKGGGKATERYFTLLLGTRIVPYDQSHVIDVTGTLITDDGLEGVFAFDRTSLTPGVQVDIQYAPKQVEVINLNFDDLVYSSFQGAVWVDVTSGYIDAGTDILPNGNTERPVNSIQIATQIASDRGFRVIQVLGDLTLGSNLGDPDDVRQLKLIGTSHVNSTLVVEPSCLCLQTSFDAFDVTGTLDGDSEITNCIVRDLEYFNGHLHDSYLAGTIKLRGTSQANISDCNILDVYNAPVIDMDTSTQRLMMPNYSGRVILDKINTPTAQVAIGLDAGEVVINSSCVSGVIAISGTGRVIDNSGTGCYVVDTTVDGSDVNNLKYLIEGLRQHHSGFGDIYFWDPFNGNDAYDGQHPQRATATFAQAHNLVTDNNHDIIIAIAGNMVGQTITNEQMVITKNYVFVRGPGRDFRMHCDDDLLPSIDMQGDGCEISGMIVTTNPTNTLATINSSGAFPLIKDIYIDGSANGIHISDGEHGIVDNVRIGHNTGFGLKVDGGSEHFVIKNSHIGSNADGGVIIDLNTGHEVTIYDTVIHGNTGYGVDISATSSGVQLRGSVSIFDNSLGMVNDLGTKTSDLSNSGDTIKGLHNFDPTVDVVENVNNLNNIPVTQVDVQAIATAVWAESIRTLSVQAGLTASESEALLLITPNVDAKTKKIIATVIGTA